MLEDNTLAECSPSPYDPESIKMPLCSAASLPTCTLEEELLDISEWFSDWHRNHVLKLMMTEII